MDKRGFRLVLGVALFGNEKLREKPRPATFHLGRKAVVDWTPEMEDLIRREYPCGDSNEIARKLGVSRQALASKAFYLGVSKDAVFLKNLRKKNFIAAGA